MANLVNTVPDISTLIKKSDYNTKIIKLEKNMKKVQTFDSSYFRGKNYFDEDGTQSYLVFLPTSRYFRLIANTKYISSWKSKGLSDETIWPYATFDYSLTPLIDYYDTKIRLQFHKGCLKQPNKLINDKGHIVNVYIVYELGASSSNVNDPTKRNCLFGAITLTKNADINKCRYSGYAIEFDRRSSFSFHSVGFGQNIIIFRVDISSSVYIGNKKKGILILGRGLEHKD